MVYFAEHAETGERVALKTVESADASLLSGIRREIHALRRVDHPGVVRIVAEGIEGDLPWYAMEVVEGRTLREYNADVAELDTLGRLARVTPVANRIADLRIDVARPRFVRAANGALPQLLGLLRDICDALAFVHGMGLVHRDLKPENVMIRPDGSPVLVDFGLAMQLRGAGGRDVLELGDGFLGTPAYMAPEQIDGELMDARVDLYALGCMMYESITGSAPFVGTVEQVLDQQVREPPERPSARVSDVPPELEEIILGLLQKRPRDRVGYADDVAAVLRRLGADERLPARRAEPHLYRPRLAGRASALGIVDAKLKNVRVARGGRVFVGGESGVGKTRFALEVGISAHRRGLGIVTGQCVSVAAELDASADVKAASLHPFRHLLATIVDWCREQGLEETERVLGPRGPALAVHEPSIASLPGQHFYPKLAALDAAGARARLNGCLAGTIAAFAEVQPLVLVLEDVQWADEASMSFLKALDDAYFAAARVLLLATYRTEERSDELRDLLAAPDVTHLELGRIDAPAVERMVSDMIAMEAPPAAFIRFLVERSEGHPFFVAEYVRSAVSEGMLFRNDAGEWQVKPLGGARLASYDALPLPELLRDMVIRRVGALGKGALAAARMAAVLGREIDTDVLAAAMSLDDVAQLEAVEELRARQIIDVDGGRLRFAHDKLREIIHGAIDADERRRLHAAAGSAIEARYANTPEITAFYPDLVHHFTTARAPDKAFEYLVKAGQAALAATASGEALGFFRRALALADASPARGAPLLDEPLRAQLESQLGEAALNVGLLPEAERLTRAALRRFCGEPIADDDSRAATVLRFVSELAPHARILLRPLPPRAFHPAERARLLGATRAAQRLTQIHFLQQKWAHGLGAALRMVNLASGLGLSLELVQGYVTLGIGLSALPLPRLQMLYEARAKETAEALDDRQGLAWVSLLQGFSALRAGRFREARGAIDVAMAQARDIQDSRQVELCLGLLILLEGLTGRPDDAAVLCDRLESAGQKSGNKQTQIWALGGKAQSALSLGNGDAAIALFERRRTLAEDYRNDPSEWITHGVVAEAHLLVGDRESARRAIDKTLFHLAQLRVVGFRFYRGCLATGDAIFVLWERATSARDRDALGRQARLICRKMHSYAGIYAVGRPTALRLQGLLDARTGHLARARRAFAASLAEAERLAMPFEQGLAHNDLGRHAEASDPAREPHFAAARALFDRLGHLRWLERVGR